MASVLDAPLFTTQVREEAATGACILAMMGTEKSSEEEIISKIIRYGNPVLPERKAAEIYAEIYPKFRDAYPALKKLFP